MNLKNFCLLITLISSLVTYASATTTQITTTLPIKKVIIWGHKSNIHTHFYIHWAFKRTFAYLGYETYWFDNTDNVGAFDFSNSLFLTEGQVDQKMPVRDDCFYILHNCNRDRYQSLNGMGRVITLQVYTHDCSKYNLTKLDDCIYYNIESALIHMPWATDLLPHEIEANKKATLLNKKNEVVFIGSIGGSNFGNIDQITPFMKAAAKNKIDFYHKMFLSLEENVARVQNAYMAPAIQGHWQVKVGYIPCRIFKNISYGAFGITNSETVYNLFKQKIVYNPDCHQLFYDTQKKLDTLDVTELYELMDFVKEKHTYINRIQMLLEFMEKVFQSNQKKEHAC